MLVFMFVAIFGSFPAFLLYCGLSAGWHYFVENPTPDPLPPLDCPEDDPICGLPEVGGVRIGHGLRVRPDGVVEYDT